MRIPRFGLDALNGLGRDFNNVSFPFSIIDGFDGVSWDLVIVLTVNAGGTKHGAKADPIGQPCLQSERSVFSRVRWAVEGEPPIAHGESVFTVGAPMADFVQEHLGEAVIGVEVVARAQLKAPAAVRC